MSSAKSLNNRNINLRSKYEICRGIYIYIYYIIYIIIRIIYCAYFDLGTIITNNLIYSNQFY